MSDHILAWMAEGTDEAGRQWESLTCDPIMADNWLHTIRVRGPEHPLTFTVTPLVAAPPTQTVEEAAETVSRFLGIALDGPDGKTESDEFSSIQRRIVEALAAAPPEGAPSYSELVGVLRTLDGDAQRASAASVDGRKWGSGVGHAVAMIRALLSRIPEADPLRYRLPWDAPREES